MKRLAVALLALLSILPVQACELAAAEAFDLQDGATLFYRVKNPPLEVGRHFALQFRLCAAGEAIKPARFEVDARMPAHNHGMNYRVQTEIAADGLLEASGFLFHMPGHWQLRVEFVLDDAIQQVNIDYRL